MLYTKSHVNTFVIISGDSDFSPLVSKLRENNKQVIGVGVKQSTSDLLIANCDEFIFYDDLVRENQRAQARRQSQAATRHRARRSPRRRAQPQGKPGRTPHPGGVELAAETFEACCWSGGHRQDLGLGAQGGDQAPQARFQRRPLWLPHLGNLLEEAQARGLLEFGRDEKSGAYVYRSHGAPSAQPRCTT